MSNPVYNADYFQTANYVDYAERVDRYHQQAAEIAALLRQIGLIQKRDLIIDYGCAVGFMVEWFRDNGYRNVVGIDTSEWARNEARKRGLHVMPSVEHVSQNADVMLALDVFEHMSDIEVASVLDYLRPIAIVVRIPCSTDGGKTFHLSASRNDPTHVNCKTKAQWASVFEERGYAIMNLNLYTVYDTAGVACLLAVR